MEAEADLQKEQNRAPAKVQRTADEPALVRRDQTFVGAEANTFAAENGRSTVLGVGQRNLVAATLEVALAEVGQIRKVAEDMD